MYFLKFHIVNFYENLSRKIHICLKSKKWYQAVVHPSIRSVCPQISARLPLKEFTWNLIWGDFYENMSRNSKFGYNRAKISGTWHEDLGTFYFCRRCEIAIKAPFRVKWYQAVTIAEVVLTLRERPTMWLYTYIAYHVPDMFPTFLCKFNTRKCLTSVTCQVGRVQKKEAIVLSTDSGFGFASFVYGQQVYPGGRAA